MSEPRPCRDCGQDTERIDPCHGYYLCLSCKKLRDRAYDDRVDPLHWYHQHDPERVCEP